MAAVKCIGLQPCCLADGRRVLPGATAKNVDLEHPENRALLTDEQIIEVSAPKRGRRTTTATSEED